MGIIGKYGYSAKADGYTFNEGALIISDKDQKWLGIHETFKF